MKKMLCAALAISMVMLAGRAPCLAESTPAPDSSRHSAPRKGPAFVFRGDAPTSEETRAYAERMQKDQAAASDLRAGDPENVAVTILAVIVVVGLTVAIIYIEVHAPHHHHFNDSDAADDPWWAY